MCVSRAAGKRVGGGEEGVKQIAPSLISHQSLVSVQCLYQKSIPVLILSILTQIHNITTISPVDDPIVCIQDVYECDDGSYVIRDSANGCQFPPCPISSGTVFNDSLQV